MKNQKLTREFKFQPFEKVKFEVEQVHKHLGAQKIVNGDAKRLCRIEDFIKTEIKEKYLKVPIHDQLTQDMKQLNKAMIGF